MSAQIPRDNVEGVQSRSSPKWCIQSCRPSHVHRPCAYSSRARGAPRSPWPAPSTGSNSPNDKASCPSRAPHQSLYNAMHSFRVLSCPCTTPTSPPRPGALGTGRVGCGYSPATRALSVLSGAGEPDSLVGHFAGRSGGLNGLRKEGKGHSLGEGGREPGAKVEQGCRGEESKIGQHFASL